MGSWLWGLVVKALLSVDSWAKGYSVTVTSVSGPYKYLPSRNIIAALLKY